MKGTKTASTQQTNRIESLEIREIYERDFTPEDIELINILKGRTE